MCGHYFSVSLYWGITGETQLCFSFFLPSDLSNTCTRLVPEYIQVNQTCCVKSVKPASRTWEVAETYPCGYAEAESII